MDGYFFLPVNNVFELIQKVYGIEFEYRLIRIGLPRYLRLDFLANVVLYHELGHFIDNYYDLSESILATIELRLASSKDPLDDTAHFKPFFPDFFDEHDNFVGIMEGFRPVALSYVSEYFADLFAAQYIGDSASQYLGYISGHTTSQFSNSHPSTDARIRLVEMQMKGENNGLLKTFGDCVVHQTGKILEKRHENIGTEDFHALVPPVVSNDRQMHGLLVAAWETWLDTRSPTTDPTRMQNRIPPKDIYRILNNLVEKSIGNYLVQQSFSSANVPA